MSDISQRKRDHIELCATGPVGFRSVTTLFECVRLVHDALPELELDELDTKVTLLGKPLRAPIVIAAMTGGTDEAAELNRTLAQIAESRGYGFGLGSQRAMHRNARLAYTYRVREVAPTALVLGNVGMMQARAMSNEQLRELAGAIGADALCVHLNPAMEIVQPEGDRDFQRRHSAVRAARRELSASRWSRRRPATGSLTARRRSCAPRAFVTWTRRAPAGRRGWASRPCAPRTKRSASAKRCGTGASRRRRAPWPARRPASRGSSPPADLASLRHAPRVLSGELRGWLDQLGLDHARG